MKNFHFLPLILLIFSLSCSKIDQDTNVLEGTYKTDRSLDISCAALPDNQLPTLQIRQTTTGVYEATFVRFNPTQKSEVYANITAKMVGTDMEFTYKGLAAGKWKTQKYWDIVSGKEMEGKILSLFIDNPKENEFAFFIGRK